MKVFCVVEMIQNCVESEVFNSQVIIRNCVTSQCLLVNDFKQTVSCLRPETYILRKYVKANTSRYTSESLYVIVFQNVIFYSHFCVSGQLLSCLKRIFLCS